MLKLLINSPSKVSYTNFYSLVLDPGLFHILLDAKFNEPLNHHTKADHNPKEIFDLANWTLMPYKQISNQIFYNFLEGKYFNDVIVPQERGMPASNFNVSWFAKESDEGGPVRRSGGRLGKIDAASESGFFFKTNKARLEGIKKELKNKGEDEDEDDDDEPAPPPKQKPAAK